MISTVKRQSEVVIKFVEVKPGCQWSLNKVSPSTTLGGWGLMSFMHGEGPFHILAIYSLFSCVCRDMKTQRR